MQEGTSGLIAIGKNSGSSNVVANVVFVHGLGGHHRETWQHDVHDHKSFWPMWLYDDLNASDDGIMRPVGVWSLGYPADIFEVLFFSKARQDSVPQRARDLVDTLVGRGLANRPIVFVTHSLGGILTKQMLRTSSDAGDPRENDLAKLALSTRLVVFLATPHTGSSMARLAQAVPAALAMVAGGVASTIDWLPVGSLARMIARKAIQRGRLTKALETGDPYLEDLGAWYRNNVQRIGVATRAYYENSKKGVAIIVDKESANPGVSGVEAIPLDADHSSICKPVSRNDHYARIAEPIKQAIRQCPVFKETHLAVLDVGERFENLAQLPAADHLSATKKVVQPIEVRLGRNPASNPVEYDESVSGNELFSVARWQETLAATSPYDLDRIILNVWRQYKGGLPTSDPVQGVRLEAERLRVRVADNARLSLVPLYYAARAAGIQRDQAKMQLGAADKSYVQNAFNLVEQLANGSGMDGDSSTRNALMRLLA